MNTGVPYLALGIGLLAETSLALGQMPGLTLVAQVTGSIPPSGVLTVPAPAPIAVPPSGVLATVEGRQVVAPETKTPQKPQTSRRAKALMMHGHVVYRRSAARREAIARAATTDKVATPSIVRTTS